MSGWPEVVQCENSSCGKKINTKSEKFTLVTMAGNVEFQAGPGKKKSGNSSHVLCERCTRAFVAKFKRKNSILQGVAMKAMTMVVFCLMFVLAGCTSLDREGTRQNDENVQVTTKENDENNKLLLEMNKLDKTVKNSRDERNKSTRNLARQMARAAGNKDLPEDAEK